MLEVPGSVSPSNLQIYFNNPFKTNQEFSCQKYADPSSVFSQPSSSSPYRSQRLNHNRLLHKAETASNARSMQRAAKSVSSARKMDVPFPQPRLSEYPLSLAQLILPWRSQNDSLLTLD